jgi:hypothetical protein
MSTTSNNQKEIKTSTTFDHQEYIGKQGKQKVRLKFLTFKTINSYLSYLYHHYLAYWSEPGFKHFAVQEKEK